MKGDFSRLTFDPRKQFTRVLMQQGRVQLDADWNEQAGILLHYLQTLAADLIGPHGGPKDDLGFAIEAVTNHQNQLTDLKVLQGRYYVDGLLCENLEPEGVSYFEQPDLALDPEQDELPDAPFLAYLDVWERHLNHLQVDGIREVALGGPDTASRAQVVWQVRVAEDLPEGTRTERAWPNAASWKKWVEGRQPQNRGRLKARAKGDPDSTDPCLASPAARYRGPENQLYRVEIQWREPEPAPDSKATRALTFKWSRENGSVVFAIREFDVEGRTVVLESLGRDEATGLKRGDWVEIVDDETETGGESWSLMKVDEINEARMSVTLKPADDDLAPNLPVYEEGEAQKKHALLRRWDHAASPPPKTGEKPKGAVLFIFQEDAKLEDTWLTLEQGIQIQFQPGGAYRPGDYWLIPARTATGDVEWPGSARDPQPVPPHGVEHHYAPLALVEAADKVRDLRRPFKALGVA